MTSEQLDYQKRSARIYQERFDNALRDIGVRAPEPVLGMHPDDYRREVLRAIKKNHLQNHEYNKLNMRGLPSEVLDNFEPMIINAAIAEAQNPMNVPPGELRQIDKLDTYGNLRERQWIGQDCFVKQMNRQGRRVVSFTTDRGKFDAAKGRWFA
jgi:hypothetical protein